VATAILCAVAGVASIIAAFGQPAAQTLPAE
jgi:hypothetical protein